MDYVFLIPSDKSICCYFFLAVLFFVLKNKLLNSMKSTVLYFFSVFPVAMTADSAVLGEILRMGGTGSHFYSNFIFISTQTEKKMTGRKNFYKNHSYLQGH
jgi:hypothetical protein